MAILVHVSSLVAVGLIKFQATYIFIAKRHIFVCKINRKLKLTQSEQNVVQKRPPWRFVVLGIYF